MKRKDRIYKAIELVSDRKFRKSFVVELHEYLKANMPHLDTGELPWACGYDLFDSPFNKLHRHFINFCKLQGVDWLFAHTIFRATYGELYCDCDYLYNLRVTDNDVEVIEEQ